MAEEVTKQKLENALFDQNPDPMLLLDVEGNCLRANAALVAEFGYSEKELQHSVKQLFAAMDVEHMQTQLQKMVAGTTNRYEMQVICKNGRRSDAVVTAIPFAVDGQLEGVYAIFHDISQNKQTEEALRSTKEQLDMFLRDSADAIWMIDLEDRVWQVNPAFEALFGWSDEDVLGKRLPIIPDSLADEIERVHQKVKAGVSMSGYITKRLHKDGRILYVSATLSPLQDREGRVIGISGTCRDITESKRAEEELRATKERLESFHVNSADAIWMIDLDDRVLQVNPAFETLFGWSEGDVMGGKLPIIPDFLQEKMDALHQQIKAGRSVAGYETIRLSKSGELVHVSATLSPVRNNRGEVVGISGTCRDISQSKLVEEELRATKELFESIFNYTTDAVIVFDLDGRIRAMNPSSKNMPALAYEEPHDRLEQLYRDLIPQHMQDRYMDVINGRMAYAEYELSRTLPDERQFDLQVTLSSICNDHGQVVALLAMAKDITESKKTQQMLIQSEKLSIAGQLAAGLAHEIRNPLTALKGFVQLMHYGEVDKKKYLGVMASELSRIEMIVSELLVLAKPQAITFKRRSIAPILDDVLTLSNTQAILHNVEILSDVADGLPELDCDENQLKQVFINFIKNAIEAMDGGGQLRIEAHQIEPERIRVRFADRGVGIPKEQLARLGEPFYTTKSKGTGLGLMVSKKIIENHHGCLEIASELGVGTTVDVYLPIPSTESSIE